MKYLDKISLTILDLYLQDGETHNKIKDQEN